MFKNKKSAVAASMVSGLALVASLAFVGGGTYARYVATAEGNGSAQVAKWAVNVTNANQSETGEFNLEFNAENNADIVAGKIAPGVTATGYVDIDLTGTEVSVEIDCKCPLSNSGDNAIPVEVTVGEFEAPTGESNMTVMPKREDNLVIVQVGNGPMNGTVRVPITLTWDSTDDDADTAAGATASDMTVPVTLQVRQHIEPTPAA